MAGEVKIMVAGEVGYCTGGWRGWVLFWWLERSNSVGWRCWAYFWRGWRGWVVVAGEKKILLLREFQRLGYQFISFDQEK